MKKIKRAIVALSYIFCAFVSNAQNQQLTLKCEQIGEIKGEQKFSAEDGWLMLTTDLYILNPEAFKGQLETIYPGRKEKDKIKNVFISGQMTSTTVAQDVRYPLYNLTVDLVNKELSVNKANTQGKIRIADNLPLNTFGTNPVDMKFYAEAINVEQPQSITDFVCRQLANVGKVSNDYSAMNKVSGEFGKLLESKMKERQYVFNSTVSLFNELDVDRKVYSICLYQFAPSNQDIERNFSSAALKKCVDDNANVDYATIRKNVANKTAPIIVAVNYKSTHKPNVRKTNQISESYVNDRVVKTRSLYASKLISDDVFTQEDDLNGLLKDYIAFDKEVKSYKENKAKGMTNINPSSIIYNYSELLNKIMMKNLKKEFLYENTFKTHYNDVQSAAKASLKDGKELEKIEKLVTVMVMEKDADTISSTQKVIANFNAINNAEALVEDTKWETNVSDLKDRYEEAYFDKVYKSKCEALLEGDPKEKEPIAEQLKKEIEASACKACMFQAVEYYFDPLEDKINVLKAEEAEKAAAEAAAAAKAAKLAKKKAMMAKKKK